MVINLLDFKNHVESSKMENVLDVTVHIDELETAARLAEPFLGCKEDAQACAGYILKVLEIHRYRFRDLVQDFRCFFRLRRIQPAGKDNITLLIETNIEHAHSRGNRNEIVLIRL